MQLFDAVVPAAGVGRRMGSTVPKQYLELLPGKCILELTLEKLLNYPAIHQVIVALSADDKLFSTLSISKHPRLYTVTGGAERADSVLCGLKATQTKWVLVHDAARPLISTADLDALTQACLAEDCGGILALRSVDTLKLSTASLTIARTVPREQIWRAQTPQCFKREQLLQALTQASAQGLKVTDEASALEVMGMPCQLVPGSALNFKITTPEDLLLAKAILSYGS